MVSGVHHSDSAVHIHVSILPPTPLTSRLPYNIEQSFPVLYLLIIHLKYSSVYVLIPNSLIILSPHPFPPHTHKFIL